MGNTGGAEHQHGGGRAERSGATAPGAETRLYFYQLQYIPYTLWLLYDDSQIPILRDTDIHIIFSLPSYISLSLEAFQAVICNID